MAFVCLAGRSRDPGCRWSGRGGSESHGCARIGPVRARSGPAFPTAYALGFHTRRKRRSTSRSVGWRRDGSVSWRGQRRAPPAQTHHCRRGMLLTKSGECESPAGGRTAREQAPRVTGEMRQGRRRWQERFGLQGKMAASYVLVTAAAVILVEGVAFGFILPNLLAGQDLISRVQQTAGDLAQQVALVSTATDHVVLPADYVLGQPGIELGPGQEQPSGNGVAVPQVRTSYPAGAPAMTLALAFTSDGTIIASTYPARYPIGSSAYAVIPTGAGYESGARGQISPVANGRVAARVQPALLAGLRSAGYGKAGTWRACPPAPLA